VAQDRTGSERLVSGVRRTRAGNGVPEHSLRNTNTIRDPFVVAKSG
jgi:hypothetical protein